MTWKSSFLAFLVSILLLLSIHFAFGCEFIRDSDFGRTSGGNGRRRPNIYRKSTNKSNRIAEFSNINIQKFQDLLAAGSDVQSAVKLLSSEIPELCQRKVQNCNASDPFRTPDGICNNIENPYWGSSYIALERILPAAYEDEYNEPRGGGLNQSSRLPNPRLVSTTIHPDMILPDSFITNMVPQIGQFLDHDLSSSPESSTGSGTDCCRLSENNNNTDCFPIEVPTNDYFYGQFNVTCRNFTRSAPYCFPGRSGIREQMNTLTAFVDASQVYGSDQDRLTKLRRLKEGKMKTSIGNARLLPAVDEMEGITPMEITGTFAAGDTRVNENPALTTLHNLFLLEHNRLADDLEKVQPGLNDEDKFQIVRRVLTAEWQKIVYGEYLPIILGPQTMAQLDLNLFPTQYSKYDSLINPGILQEFSTAAYRFGHSMVNGLIRLMRDTEPVCSYQVRDGFFQDKFIKYNDSEGYDLILAGLMRQNSQSFDAFVTEDVTNFVLREPERNFGEDLIARNILRGRDHGIPSYNKNRKLSRLPSLTTWDNRPAEIPESTWTKLESLYETPDDIDLFTGGLSETPLSGAVTGPTFNSIIAVQFQRIKSGDRFFYTHEGQAGSFTLNQIEKINRRTLGDIICQNSNVPRTPKDVFKTASPSNPWIDCGDQSHRKLLNIGDFL